MRRSVNLASNTLKADLTALKGLYLWAQSECIDLEERILRGQHLSLAEGDRLKAFVRRPMKATSNESPATRPTNSKSQISLEALRRSEKKAKPELDHHTYVNRLRIIATYLEWLSATGMRRFDALQATECKKRADAMTCSLLAALPKNRKRNQIGRREGPPEEVITKLLDVVRLDSLDNPWEDAGLRARNQLLIHLLFGLGIRRGEALGIKVEHIDFRKNEILIARQADEPSDPRINQPQTKTLDRRLLLNDSLAKTIHDYVLHVRRKLPNSGKHGYLLVSTRDGAPMSLSMCTKVFRVLRERVDGLPNDLTSHVLRHAWNDAFSALVDRNNIPPEKEEKMRSYLQGWREGSGTSATYTRRSIRRRADEVLTRHQGNIVTRNDGKK